MRAVISYLLQPLPIFGLLIIAAFVFKKLNKHQVKKVFFALAAIWMLLISTSFVPDLLIRHLENQYPVFKSGDIRNNDDSVHILVLGGGHVNDDRLEVYDQLVETALSRITEGVRIHKLYPNSKLITSGFEGKERLSNAEMAARTAISFGVDSNKIYQQREPENTQQEAVAYKSVFGSERTLILVTSAAHMPRAMKLFKHEGLNPIAAPTNHLHKKSEQFRFFYWIPYSYNIRAMESAMHEYIGLLHLALRPGKKNK